MEGVAESDHPLPARVDDVGGDRLDVRGTAAGRGEAVQQRAAGDDTVGVQRRPHGLRTVERHCRDRQARGPRAPRPVHRLAKPGRHQRAPGRARGRVQPDPRPSATLWAIAAGAVPRLTPAAAYVEDAYGPLRSLSRLPGHHLDLPRLHGQDPGLGPPWAVVPLPARKPPAAYPAGPWQVRSPRPIVRVRRRGTMISASRLAPRREAAGRSRRSRIPDPEMRADFLSSMIKPVVSYQY